MEGDKAADAEETCVIEFSKSLQRKQVFFLFIFVWFTRAHYKLSYIISNLILASWLSAFIF